jgi:anti-sigma B factor antagonist
VQIKVSKNSCDVYLLQLSGVLDLSGADQLKDVVMKVYKNKVERFIINMCDIKSVDSSGIGALISIFSTLRKLSCPLVIIAVEGPVMHALETSRIKGYFTIARSMQEAVSLLDA